MYPQTSDEPLTLDTLTARVSPPPIRTASVPCSKESNDAAASGKSHVAAIEAGESNVDDHLRYFSHNLRGFIRQARDPRLSMDEYISLYQRNENSQGHHFVVHQHDHPVAGTHYDLRLQINETSSTSWAIMYGLPGNPGSRRLNRNATETRVHCLWNHLIETASHATGSLLIWDTGEYEVLPYYQSQEDDDTDRGSSSEESETELQTGQPLEPEKLHHAFNNHKIRVRLHGSRLPKGYTITLRMSSASKSRTSQPKKPSRKRRRKDPRRISAPKLVTTSDDNSDEEVSTTQHDEAHSDVDNDEAIRTANAYPGANNTIGSIHQRVWYLSLDRHSSGFKKQRDSSGAMSWTRRGECLEAPDFEAFVVRGRDHEQSVLTGRLAEDVLRDEGIENYVGRAGWKGILQ